MDTEGFIRWALDGARTVEERFTVELLVEEAVWYWHARHQTGHCRDRKKTSERERERLLNPAYDPRYSEKNLRLAVEVLAEKTTWRQHRVYQQRPIRDLTALRFLPQLEEVKLAGLEVTDCSPLADLPRLRLLEFASKTCEDFTPLARCARLRDLTLSLNKHWPELAGLEKLDQLERLVLWGNLLALPPGLVWPRVRRGGLTCTPLAMRCVRDLPCFPACEFLTLGGVERLEGIEAFPRLRNLTLKGPVRDFTPLAALHDLTWLACQGAEPLDVAPLTRLPRLQFLSFHSQHVFGIDKAKPRDFSPLTDAPLLRELHVTGCPPVEAEVATLNTLLLPWDDVLLAPQPRPLPPLRMIVAPRKNHPPCPEIARGPEDTGLVDDGLRECEGRWLARFVTRAISDKLGHADWGTVVASGKTRRINATIESFGVVEKLPQILQALREVLARLRHDCDAEFMIALKAPRPEPTPAQVELEQQFQDEQDKAGFERSQREQREYLDRLHRYDLKKEGGAPIDPKEFAPAPPAPLPPPPWERDDDDEADGDDSGSGGLAVKKKPDPPPSFLDDEHPLADNYRLLGTLTLSEVWFMPHHRDVAVYLMGRPPDQEIPPEPA